MNYRYFIIIATLVATLVLVTSCHHTADNRWQRDNTTRQEIDARCVSDLWNDSLRQQVKPGSFVDYLGKLTLKPVGYPVHLWNGEERRKVSTYRVIEFRLDSVDLQQCADAVIRLRAEYLWHKGEYDRIKFHFTNGFVADYDRWAHGERIKLNAAQTQCSWYRKSGGEDYSYDTFRDYLLLVFTYAGTRSLGSDMIEDEDYSRLDVGDVILQAGSPGHAMICVGDGLLAQSYMPAQELEMVQCRVNMRDGRIATIETPDWNYTNDYRLMHFPAD